MPNALNVMVDSLTDRVYNVATKSVPMTSGNIICKKTTPWWNAECSRLVSERRKARKILEKHQTKSNLLDYNRKTAAAREMCVKSKKKTFQSYVSTLQHDTPIKTVWSKMKLFESSYTRQIYPLITNNVVITTRKKKKML